MKTPGRILITGVCGFAGSVLAKGLREALPGTELCGIDSLIRKGSESNTGWLREMGVDLHLGDIRDEAAVDRLPAADWVLDCAANPSVLAGVEGPMGSKELLDHNLTGTIHLLEYCKRHRAGFLLMSTSRVYSIPALASIPVREEGGMFRAHVPPAGLPGLTERGITEDFSTEPPLSLYGSSKRCAEFIALEYGSAFGFPVWINRCGVLAGAGQFGRPDQGIFAYWINAWLRKQPLRYIGFEGLGHQVRDCLHPRDLVPLLVRQMQEPERPVKRIQNLGGGTANSMSLRQLSDWCRNRFGEHSVAPDPQPRPFDLPWMVLDSSLAEAQWGWRPGTALPGILEEIAQHAEAHPGWLELSGVR